jgi:hypothetical protein
VSGGDGAGVAFVCCGWKALSEEAEISWLRCSSLGRLVVVCCCVDGSKRLCVRCACVTTIASGI